jgi:SNF family Na+-dependent transporter
MIHSMLDTIANSSLGIAIAEDPVLFPWIEVAHVLAITIVFGSILLVDLRLAGLAARDYPISRLSKAIVPVTWIAFIIAAISGSLMFVSNPVTYYENFAFRAKIALMLCAALNMAIFHIWTMRSMARWDEAPRIPLGVRFAGLISILLWVAIIVFGRWIGFTMSPF